MVNEDFWDKRNNKRAFLVIPIAFLVKRLAGPTFVIQVILLLLVACNIEFLLATDKEVYMALGLGFVPLGIGWVLNKFCIAGERITADGATVTQYDYTLPMLIFAAFGVIAIIITLMLKKEDAKKGYGLE